MDIIPSLEPKDAITYTHLKQTFESKGFQRFLERLEKLLDSDYKQLAIEKKDAENHRNQGRAQRTDTILLLPAQMLAECKSVKENA